MSLVVSNDKVGAAHREKSILIDIERLKFCIKFKKSFKDDKNLYYVFEYCPFGTIKEFADQFP